MKKTMLIFALTAAMLLSLAACGAPRPTPANREETLPQAGTESPAPADALTTTGQEGEIEFMESAAPEAGRQDGERFEDTILLEGMEETVYYEHVRNDALGLELDYEYEEFERRSGPEGESFVSRWDSADDPWNYLELKRDTGNAELVASALKATLSGAYDSVSDEYYTLAQAGQCIRVSASGAKAGLAPAGSMQTVYVIPAGSGCVIATAHYTMESAEGFGVRFAKMLDTLALIGG